jgi:AhpD family alkylhydroperoxidase
VKASAALAVEKKPRGGALRGFDLFGNCGSGLGGRTTSASSQEILTRARRSPAKLSPKTGVRVKGKSYRKFTEITFMGAAPHCHDLCPCWRRMRRLCRPSQAAFDAFSHAAFADGALPAKLKQIIAVAVAHVTQCPYCINGHTKAALRAGASPEELMEAVWVAAEMRAGGAYAHSTLMLATLAEEQEKRKS